MAVDPHTAMHEAAHATTAWVVGMPLDFVRVNGSGGLCQIATRE